MAQIYDRIKKPIGVTLVYGETATDTFEAIALEPNIRGMKVVSFGHDGSSPQTLKTDSTGRLEILPGFDGTSYLPLLVNTAGQLLVGNDGTAPTYILTNPDGTVRVEAINQSLAPPESKVNLFNTTITDTTPILASDITPTYSPTLFRIYAVFDTALRFEVLRTVGTITVVEQLNGGANVNAGAAYMFDILVDSGESINFQAYIDGTGTTTATLFKMSVVEKPGVT